MLPAGHVLNEWGTSCECTHVIWIKNCDATNLFWSSQEGKLNLCTTLVAKLSVQTRSMLFCGVYRLGVGYDIETEALQTENGQAWLLWLCKHLRHNRWVICVEQSPPQHFVGLFCGCYCVPPHLEHVQGCELGVTHTVSNSLCFVCRHPKMHPKFSDIKVTRHFLGNTEQLKSRQAFLERKAKRRKWFYFNVCFV